MIFTIAHDAQSLAQALAERLLREAWAASAQGRPLRIALSGGSTPALFYRELARRNALIPWSTLEIYFSDERAVPPDHPDSNFRLAYREWLINAPAGAQIYRIPGEKGAPLAASAYEERLTAATLPGFFDIIFLGLGTDGHIASLFPGDPLTAPEAAIAIPATPTRTARVSLSFATLTAARTRIVLTAGAAKAEPLRQALTAGNTTPIALLARKVSVEFWLDQAAAAGLCPFP